MMGDSLRVVATVRIDRPYVTVRAQFFDIDHHIRANIFKGVQMSYLPATAGERRFRQEVRLVGLPQVDSFTMERAADGSLIKRFVQGPNAGLELYERFCPEGPDITVVSITATLPTPGIKRLATPILRLALQRALDDALADHKYDIEVRGYAPPGTPLSTLAADPSMP